MEAQNVLTRILLLNCAHKIDLIPAILLFLDTSVLKYIITLLLSHKCAPEEPGSRVDPPTTMFLQVLLQELYLHLNISLKSLAPVDVKMPSILHHFDLLGLPR